MCACACELTGINVSSMMDEAEAINLLTQGDLFAAEQDVWVKKGLFRFMNTEQQSHVSLGIFTKFMCGAWFAGKATLWHLAFHVYDYTEQGFLDTNSIRHIIRLSNEVAESHRRYNINVRSKVIAVYLRDNAQGSCSGESPEDNLQINENHWLIAVEKFPELLSPVTALLKQPQLAVEEVSAIVVDMSDVCNLYIAGRHERRYAEECAESFAVHEQWDAVV